MYIKPFHQMAIKSQKIYTKCFDFVIFKNFKKEILHNNDNKKSTKIELEWTKLENNS